MDDLLRPSLSSDKPTVSLFSTRAGFFMAFFGGPIAVTFFSALNSRKLERLKDDMLFYAIGVILFVVLVFTMLNATPDGESIINWLQEQRRNNPLFRYGSKVLALVLWGGYYYLHRPYHRAMQFAGIDSPSPWKAAFTCLGLSLIVEIPLILGLLAWKTGMAF